MSEGEEMRLERDRQSSENRRSIDPAKVNGAGSAPREVVDKQGKKSPVKLDYIPIDEIDLENTTYQFRLGDGFSRLTESLAKEGQYEPIKTMAGDHADHVILDGFTRLRALRKLGVDRVQALIFPALSEHDAWEIALGSNLLRQNLSARDRANAMLRAREHGFATPEIAALCKVDSTTVHRWLALPERILEHVDGKLVTLAHATVLMEVCEGMTDEELAKWAARIRQRKMSATRLKKELRDVDFLAKKSGRRKSYCCVSPGEIRTYARTFTKRSGVDNLKRARAEILRSVAEIEAILAG